MYVECLPYSEVITRYDRPGTFFYIDPPYWDCEGYYGPGIFSREDFGRLAAQLAGMAGGKAVGGRTEGKDTHSPDDPHGLRAAFGLGKRIP